MFFLFNLKSSFFQYVHHSLFVLLKSWKPQPFWYFAVRAFGVEVPYNEAKAAKASPHSVHWSVHVCYETSEK